MAETAGADPMVAARTRAILASQAVQNARTSPVCRHDVPLLATVDGVILDLAADLVYESAEGTVLVTYELDETTAPPTGTAIAPAPRQRAGLLALAYQAAAGRSAHAVEIVHAASGATTRRADLAALMAQTRAVLSDEPNRESQL